MRLVGGGVERGAVVIGADGLHSRVRTALMDDGPPRYAGITAWRGVVPLDDTLGRRVSGGETFGRGSLFGVAALNGSQVYWWAAMRCREAAVTRRAQRGPRCCARSPSGTIRSPSSSPRRRRTPSSAARSRPAGAPALERRPRRPRGRCRTSDVAEPRPGRLPGDRGRGGARRGTGRVGRARGARAIRARRAEHTADVARASRQMSRVAHLRSPVAAGLRNTVLRVTPASASLRRLQPIVGHVLGERPA